MYSVYLYDPFTGYTMECIASNRTLNDATAIAGETEERYKIEGIECRVVKEMER